MYSIHSIISCGEPLPTLPLTYASAPNISHRSMNSCVPKAFVSTPPQLELERRGRLSRGPMPSRQWYSSAKQPPGQRRTGTCSSFRAASTSLRSPRVWDRRVFSDPDAFVNETAEVFSKLAVDVAIDGPSWLVQTNSQRRLIGILCVGESDGRY